MIESKGHLNPGDDGVCFDRFPLGSDLDALVRHVWVVRWDLPVGRVRPQRVLTYPVCNAVITPEECSLHGPQQRVFVRELSGTSWAVGVLLRPAAARVLTDTPSDLLPGHSEPLPGAPWERIARAMAEPGLFRESVTVALRSWLLPLMVRIDDAGLLVNEACRLAEEEADVVEVADLARRLDVPRRSLGRLVKEHTGLTPKWLIECRRLQEAATILYRAPATDLAGLAGDLGYADQAHFTRRYHRVLGETPDRTRRAGREAQRKIPLR